jgi:CO/xanthine dehydrogenase FAD-binding subunit
MSNGYTPSNLADALKLLAEQTLIPYAGGSDLMVSEDKNRPFLFLHRIPELKRFEDDGQTCFIGAGLTYTELLSNARTPALLRTAIASIAAPALRNTATIGGNVANASPKGDAALALTVTDATVHLAGANGKRQVPLRSFYLGRGQTVRQPDELLVGFSVPRQWLDGYRFEKAGGRAALAISRVSFAGLYAEKDGRVAHLAIAFGAVEDTIVCHPEMDARLIGKTVPEAQQLVDGYVADYAAILNPIQGRVSAEYRKQVCINFLRDFLNLGKTREFEKR